MFLQILILLPFCELTFFKTTYLLSRIITFLIQLALKPPTGFKKKLTLFKPIFIFKG